VKQGALAGYKIASFETTYDHVRRIYDSTKGKEVIYGGCAKTTIRSGEQQRTDKGLTR
jgi:hypothetical protein